MPLQNELGLPMSGAAASSLAHFERGLRDLQRYAGDPVAAADSAIADSPGFVMAYVLKGYLFGLSTDVAAESVVAECHRAASALPATRRESAHVAALGALASRRWHEAGRILEDLTIEEPRDALGLLAGHQIDFFTGNSRMLRDRIARAMPAWSAAMPGYHATLAMQAFGLEEMGDYARAESLGRRAIDLEPRDGWAQHAVAHVMEMQCRQRDGIAWMRGNVPAWTEGSFLQIHNWWHLALFHHELGETDEVMALFDGPIRAGESTMALNLVDASALLWRLHLRGVDAGERWARLAAAWEPKAADGNYAFNDVHAMMAFSAAGLDEAAERLLRAQEGAMADDGDNAAFTRDVGRPVSLAIYAFGKGSYSEAARLLRPIRAVAHRFGGSHAQRDVIDLTLIEAALRAGDAALSRALTAERAMARPDSPLSGLLARRAGSLGY